MFLKKIIHKFKLNHTPVRSLKTYLTPEKKFHFHFNKYKFDKHTNQVTLDIYKTNNVSVYTKYGILVGDGKDFCLNQKSFKFVIQESTQDCLEKVIATTKENILDNNKVKFLKLKNSSYIVNNPATRKNYCHFLMESYLKILLILFSGEKKINLLYSNDIVSFEKEHIKVLKNVFPKNINLKKINLTLPIKIKSNVYIVSSVRFIGGNFIRHPVELVKNIPKKITSNLKFKKLFLRKNKKIILISRSHSRIIKNEKEIKKKIPEIEFYNFDNLSVKKQIELFYNAKVIISVFGAALANLIFSNNNTKLIYLRPKNLYRSKEPNKIEDEYYDLSKSLNKKTYLLNCDSLKNKDGSNLDIRFENKEKDFFSVLEPEGSYFIVNIKKLKKIIKKII